MLEPRDVNDKIYHREIVFEFKRVTEKEQLKAAAQAALQQIKHKKYVTEMQERGVHQVIGIGIAFYQRSLQEAYDFL